MNPTNHLTIRAAAPLYKGLLACAFALIFLIFCSSTAFATGQVRGHVTGTDGKPVVGLPVQVWIFDTLGCSDDSCFAGSRAQRTDKDGNYSISLDAVDSGEIYLGFLACDQDWGCDHDYLNQYYPNKYKYADAELIAFGTDSRLEINAVLIAYGTLTGVITGEDHQPVQRGYVTAVHVSGNGELPYGSPNFNGGTREGRRYVLRVPPGVYIVSFGGDRNVPEYYLDKYDPKLADLVTVTTATTSTLNAQLVKMSTITGRVTDHQGHPMPNATVTLLQQSYYSDGSPADWSNATQYFATPTDANGVYTITTVPGSYRIEFSKGQGYETVFPPIYYPDSRTVDEAKIVEVGLKAALAHIDVSVDSFGILRGRITDLEGNPVQGNIEIYDHLDEYLPLPVGDTQADANGYYTLTVHEVGHYYVHIFVPTDGHFPSFTDEFYDHEADYHKADLVAIGLNQVVSLDIKLPPPFSISGKVTDMAGNAIAGTDVDIYTDSGNDHHATTNSNGNYLLRGFYPGDYTVMVFSREYKRQFFSNYYKSRAQYEAGTDSDILHINRATPDLELNFRLLNDDENPKDFDALYGLVVNQDNLVVPGIMVRAYHFRDGKWIEAGSDLTDGKGQYVIIIVDQGPYRLKFEDAPFAINDADYTTTYYPSKASIDEAEDIKVDSEYAGTLATILDIPDISGRVTNQAGAPIAGATVLAYHLVENNGQSEWQCCAAQTQTDAGGDYELIDLPPGIYRLLFEARWQGYMNQFYANATLLEQAQEIPIALGNSANAKDVKLAGGLDRIKHLFLPSARNH